jgi:murein L,D-transpeptidase YafK
MKVFRLFVLIGCGVLSLSPQQDFLTAQKQYVRVRTAIKEKQSYLEQKLKENGYSLNTINILLVAYKAESIMEVYVKKKGEQQLRKLFTYSICARSGQLGPKRRYGDGQVPEGFYEINRFNPTSSFYLSLGLNYPNLSDKRKSTSSNLGGDIFIHGACVTIGCMPMTDAIIKEIYLLAIHAKNTGQLHIPVYIFPFKMNDRNWEEYQLSYKNYPDLLAFWKNLKTGYDTFVKQPKVLSFQVTSQGDYHFLP